MLELNPSLFFITFLIIILALILNRIFFRPIGKIMDEREFKIQNDAQTLNAIMEEILANTRSVEARFQGAQREAAKIKEGLIQKGEEIRRKMVEDAREKSQVLLAEKMTEMDRQLKEAEKELEQQIHVFSQQITESFL